MNEEIPECVFVRLTKFGISEAPRTLTPTAGHIYTPGTSNPRWSLPLGYWLEGWLIGPPQIGRCVRVLRVNRNGVPRLGVFVSTPVVALLGGWSFGTANSLYRCVAADAQAPLPGDIHRIFGQCERTGRAAERRDE